jgi:hypothetical protein
VQGSRPALGRTAVHRRPNAGGEDANVLATLKVRPGNIRASLVACVPADLDGGCACRRCAAIAWDDTLAADPTRPARRHAALTLHRRVSRMATTLTASSAIH